MLVTPDSSSLGLSMFIYSDGDPSMSRTINDYSDIGVYAVTRTNIAIVGRPETGRLDQRLVVLHESYSDQWMVSSKAKHVLVDGMVNGWLVGSTTKKVTLTYQGSILIAIGKWISIISALGLAIAYFVLRLRKTILPTSRSRPRN
jgi:hypothetical protein